MPTLILIASARKDGDTAQVVSDIVKETGWDVLDLLDFKISPYDYSHANRDDDFLPLIRKITSNYDTIVFATPVYWYAMSGLLKNFFDRFSDLLTIEKDLGRKLRGMRMAAISSSVGGNLGESFWQPFQHSAEYLGMHYLGHVHTYGGKNNAAEIEKFIEQVQNWESK